MRNENPCPCFREDEGFRNSDAGAFNKHRAFVSWGHGIHAQEACPASVTVPPTPPTPQALTPSAPQLIHWVSLRHVQVGKDGLDSIGGRARKRNLQPQWIVINHRC